MKTLVLSLWFATTAFGQASLGMPGAVGMPASQSNVQHTPHSGNSAVIYGAITGGPSNSPIPAWMNSYFDWIMGGSPPVNNPTNQFTQWNMGYVDFTYALENQWWAILNPLLGKYPYNFAEDIYIHATLDVNSTSVDTGDSGPARWDSATANFDTAEPIPPGSGTVANGIWDFDGTSNWLDLTYQINIQHSAAGINNGHQAYFGYSQPYDQINFTLAAGRVGGAVAYQYWSGTTNTWATLTTRSDTTSGMTTSGQILFNPPSDWKRTNTVGTRNSNQKYWIRIAVSGSPTTAPQYSFATAKDWSTGVSTGNNICGYSRTAAGRINIGTELEYNPTPPANATCNFRYQSRLPNHVGAGAGQSTRSYFNFGFVEPTGDDPLALFLFYDGVNSTNGLPGQNGMMFDDYMGNAPAYSGNTDQSATYQFPGGLNSATAAVNYFHNYYGQPVPGVSGYQVGANGGATPAPGYQFGPFEWQLCEGTWCSLVPFLSKQAILAYGITTSGYAQNQYDLAANPTNNPRNGKYMETCNDMPEFWDPVYTGNKMSGYHFVDLSNRTPMVCLAMHYMAWNPNTMFAYYNQGNNYYYQNSDDVQYYYATDTLTSNLTANNTGGTFTFTLAGGNSNCYNRMLIGTPGLNISGVSLDASFSGGLWSTSSYTGATVPSNGSTVYCVGGGHLSQMTSPTIAQVYRWGNWFPARATDIGVPDPAGLNGGARMISTQPLNNDATNPWMTGAAATGLSSPYPGQCNLTSFVCSEVWRRDYTKAIVLLRPWGNPGSSLNYIETEVDTPSVPITLGATYYRLQADGYTGGAITTIQLRADEGAVLMKNPIVPPPTYSVVIPYIGAIPVTVTISDAIAGAAINYCIDTTNTCNPSTSGTSATISSNGYLRSTATFGGQTSPVSSGQFTQGTVATPTFSPPTQYVGLATTVTVTDITLGANMVYCTDTANLCTPATSIASGGTIAVSSTGYIRVQASKAGWISPAVAVWNGAVGAAGTFISSLGSSFSSGNTGGYSGGNTYATGSFSSVTTAQKFVLGEILYNGSGTTSLINVAATPAGITATLEATAPVTSGTINIWLITITSNGNLQIQSTKSGGYSNYVYGIQGYTGITALDQSAHPMSGIGEPEQASGTTTTAGGLVFAVGKPNGGSTTTGSSFSINAADVPAYFANNLCCATGWAAGQVVASPQTYTFNATTPANTDWHWDSISVTFKH